MTKEPDKLGMYKLFHESNSHNPAIVFDNRNGNIKETITAIYSMLRIEKYGLDVWFVRRGR